MHVSRQRRWQIKQAAKGRCRICGCRPRLRGLKYCRVCQQRAQDRYRRQARAR